jgi:hypothetical protein
MRTPQEIINSIISDKLDRFTLWMSNTIDGDEKTVSGSFLLSDGVLSEQARNFLLATPSFNAEQTLDIPTARASVKHQFEKEIEYLIHPQKFLTDYLATDSSLKEKIDSLSAYEYFPIILRERLKVSPSSTSIRAIVSDIDSLLMKYATPSCMIELLGEIYDVIQYRGFEPKLESELLSEYFIDKGMPTVSKAFNETPQSEFTLHESIDLLSSLLIKKDIQNLSSLESSYVSDYSNVEVPQYTEFVEELKEAGVQVIPYQPIFQDKQLLPFEFYLSDKAVKRIKENVFYGNEKKYHEFIETLNTSRDKETAFINIDTTLELQRIDKTSKTARRLFEALDQRYSE